ncbi:hypothetical protein AVEN_169001-1 [Araneus ventricosus]|uniref:Uncharacterized protein n=1 Tax=Araneus ventricosus TaxID=182803 RepID=A0A4Y2VCQ1_ARAVE|nr:hypothetical protein AVEN_169001-1 [Araneus ventricosus]
MRESFGEATPAGLIFDLFLYETVVVGCSLSENGKFGSPEAVLGDKGTGYQKTGRMVTLDMHDSKIVQNGTNASSACGEENRRIACSLNSLRMRRDCFKYASKTRLPKCLLPYKISPPELVFGKLPSFRSVPSLHRHFYHYACVWSSTNPIDTNYGQFVYNYTHPRKPLCPVSFGHIARGSGQLNGSKDRCEDNHVSLLEHFLPRIPIQLTRVRGIQWR